MRTPLRLSYANVTATLALLVALSGTAVAAGLGPGSVGTAQLKAGAVTTAKLANRDIVGTKIDQGAVGPGHLNADAVELARTGPPTPVGGGAVGLPDMSNNGAYVNRWQSVYGNGTALSDRSAAFMISPGTPTRARGFRAQILNDLPPGATVYVALDYATGFTGQEAAVLSCTITGTSGSDDRGCSDDRAATIPPSSFVFVQIVVHGAPGTVNPSAATWGLTLSPTT